MSFWDVTGFIVKGVAKGVGYVANEVVKQATGIDIASEISPIVEVTKESNTVSKQLKSFEENREFYIEKYGKESYEAEKEMLEWDAELKREEARYVMLDKKDEVYDRLSEQVEKQEKINALQEKIENLSDEQILSRLKRNDLSNGVRCLLEKEKLTRGI